jgi:23S rRNA (cytidine1920-2'-O)/16S rRNA (cytidine1409-2'-O)-methyltransferase
LLILVWASPRTDRIVCATEMTLRKERVRLDVLVYERGLAASREKAQAMILAGEVLVNGVAAAKAGQPVVRDAVIEVNSRIQKYVSRGGFKLEGALRDFSVDVTGKTSLDLGSSNGGFTDCLLQHGAVRVYAVDVNVEQLDWKLQQDARVIRIKKNAREFAEEDLPEKVSVVVADVSFISVTKILPAILPVAEVGSDFLILIKPQFELRREDVGPGGIVSDAGLHQHAIDSVRDSAVGLGLEAVGVRTSQLAGAEGNQEFFLHARKRI